MVTESPASTSTGFVTTLINVFVSPGEAFSSIKIAPTIIPPLLLVLISNIAFYAWYYAIVDYPWLVDALIERMGDAQSEELEGTRSAYETMGTMGMAATTLISVSLLMPLMIVIQAAYFNLVSSTLNGGVSFKQWFSLVIWTSAPGLILAIIMMANLLFADSNQVAYWDLNSLAFTNLGFDAGQKLGLQSLYDALNLASLWSIGLLVLAYKQWTNSSWAAATTISIAPYLIIYGAWAAIALN